MKRSIFVFAAFVTTSQATSLHDVLRQGSYEGSIRLGYEHQDGKNSTAVGGKLQYQTAEYKGFDARVTFYTVQGVGNKENLAIPFFDANEKSYTLLGELYLEKNLQNTTITLGRQILDTPFVNSDDVGMIPNIFEAYTLLNTDVKNTTVMFSHIVKWAGVDAEDPASFSSLNPGNGLQMAGFMYEGMKNMHTSLWYYYAKELVKVTYLETKYENRHPKGSFSFAMQYALEDFYNDEKANVYGFRTDIGWDKNDILLSLAYNKTDSDGIGADNLWGGGPFFAAAEHLTPAEAGINGETFLLSCALNSAKFGMDGVNFMLSYFHMRGDNQVKADEVDFVVSYEADEMLTYDLIYSDVNNKKEGWESFENLRAYVNYHF